MGYTTNFTGSLKIDPKPTVPQIAALKAMFGEDCRDHPEWKAPDLYYIDLEFTDDFSGVKHDGAEKTYDLDRLVNVVLRVMRQTWPDFGFSGSMMAQGEDVDDRWQLVIEDGQAVKRDVLTVGTKCKCPSCGHSFLLEGESK